MKPGLWFDLAMPWTLHGIGFAALVAFWIWMGVGSVMFFRLCRWMVKGD